MSKMGTMNLIGALKRSMAITGYAELKESSASRSSTEPAQAVVAS